MYAINPIQSSRYRERLTSSGAKSDPGDAHVLAEIVRLDAAHHRPVVGDSDLADEVKTLARTHQSLIWTRQRTTNTVRSMLREYYLAALVAFADDLAGRDSLAVLAAAPSPEVGARLSVGRIERLLRKAGRQRNITTVATQIHAALHTQQLQPAPGVVRGNAAVVLALVHVIAATVVEIETLAG